MNLIKKSNGERFADIVWPDMQKPQENQNRLTKQPLYKSAGFVTFHQFQDWWRYNCPIKLK